MKRFTQIIFVLVLRWFVPMSLVLSGVNVLADDLPVINSFTAQPASIASGSSTVLNWSITNPGSLWISADNGGDVGDVRGKTSITVKPKVTTTYTITASSGAGNAVQSVTVTVSANKVPVISSFSPDNGTITAGQSATLSWAVSNATSLAITPGGSVTGTSSLLVTPSTTTKYSLKASNASGSVTKTTTITVATQPTISSFTASASSVVSGTKIHLSWVASAGATLTLSPGGSVAGTGVDVTPLASTTYTLTATNIAGSTAMSIPIDVQPAPPVPVIRSFTATSPANAGSPATLNWDISGADSVSIDNGIGVVMGTSLVVNPSVTTTYVLSATNAAGTASSSATVSVPFSGGAATVVSMKQIHQDWGQSTWSSNAVQVSNVQAGDAIVVLGMYWVSSGTSAAPSDSNGQLVAAVNQVPSYQHPPVGAQIYYELNAAAGTHSIVPPNLAYGGDGTMYVLQVRGLSGLRAVGDTHSEATGIQSIAAHLTSGVASAGDFIVAVGGEDDSQVFSPAAGMSAPPAGWQAIGAQNDAVNNVPSAAYYATASAAGNQSLTWHWDDIYTNVAGGAVVAFSVAPAASLKATVASHDGAEIARALSSSPWPLITSTPKIGGIASLPATLMDLRAGNAVELANCLAGAFKQLTGRDGAYKGQSDTGGSSLTQAEKIVSFYPLAVPRVAALGITTVDNGVATLATNCGSISVAPALYSANEFGAAISDLGFTANIGSNGVITVDANGTLYVGRPDYFVTHGDGVKQGLHVDDSGVLSFTDSKGYVQVLYPAIPDAAALQAAASVAMGSMSRIEIQVDGSVVVTGANGETKTLTPARFLTSENGQATAIWVNDSANHYQYRVGTRYQGLTAVK